MNPFAWLKRMFAPQPRLSYGRSGPELDPNRMYEFLFAVSFPDRHAAEMCVLSLSHLNVVSKIGEGGSGRCSADFRFTGKGDPATVIKIKSSIEQAAQRHGGKLVITAVGNPAESAPS
jgi:hypothetical protein